MFVVCQDSKSEFSHWVKVACFFFCGVFAQKMIHKNYLKTAWMLNMVKPYIDLGVFFVHLMFKFQGCKICSWMAARMVQNYEHHLHSFSPLFFEVQNILANHPPKVG